METDRSVKIDYLAFTFPIACMKSVTTFNSEGHEWRKYEPLPRYPRCSRNETNNVPVTGAWNHNYTALPDIEHIYSVPLDKRNIEADIYNKALINCLHSRMRLWICNVFGLKVGCARGVGGFAYEDSAVLYCEDGGSDIYGMIYWGGNNGTVYIQISGMGCNHVFSGTTSDIIFKWFNHLNITSLKRIDLAVDDYDDVFTCNDALKVYKDDAFYCGSGPKPALGLSSALDANGVLTKEIVNVGSRQSRVYWRIYNKALEQGVSGSWYRSEAELKGVSVDVLLDIQGTFTGLCAYAASINPAPPRSIRSMLGRIAVDAIEQKVKWLRKQASATISRVINFFDGDITAALSMILREEDIENAAFTLPPVYKRLVLEKIEDLSCPF